MINYLSMLGWNDGTEQEIYTVGAVAGGTEGVSCLQIADHHQEGAL